MVVVVEMAQPTSDNLAVLVVEVLRQVVLLVQAAQVLLGKGTRVVLDLLMAVIVQVAVVVGLEEQVLQVLVL